MAWLDWNDFPDRVPFRQYRDYRFRRWLRLSCHRARLCICNSYRAIKLDRSDQISPFVPISCGVSDLLFPEIAFGLLGFRPRPRTNHRYRWRNNFRIAVRTAHIVPDWQVFFDCSAKMDRADDSAVYDSVRFARLEHILKSSAVRESRRLSDRW